ncbi:YegP family protein [Pseudonocardia sp. H11422]|uniref:YegP family protein n=1 Tax=Pseudonocardia sp. H11422 TaxID=2835866 RepID=UPI001BDBEF7D|nr:YegP family protein [Pseudonocardia sp. H11422]
MVDEPFAITPPVVDREIGSGIPDPAAKTSRAPSCPSPPTWRARPLQAPHPPVRPAGRLRLKAGNGQVVASGEAYETKAAALTGYEAVQRAADARRSKTEPMPCM